MKAVEGMPRFRERLAEAGIEFTLGGLDAIGDLALALMEAMGVSTIQVCDPDKAWGFQFSESPEDPDGYDYVFVEFDE